MQFKLPLGAKLYRDDFRSFSHFKLISVAISLTFVYIPFKSASFVYTDKHQAIDLLEYVFGKPAKN